MRADQHATSPTFLQRLGLLCRSRNMWLFGSLQFGVNLGWAFLVTLLPTYLNEVFDLPLEEIGLMQTVVLGIGCLGMIFGGVVTDMAPRLARPEARPVGPDRASRSAGAPLAFFLVPALAVGVGGRGRARGDGVPGGHAQPVDLVVRPGRGREERRAPRSGSGTCGGTWAAALSPVLLMAVRNAAGWDVVFVVCGSAFAAAAAAGCCSTRPSPWTQSRPRNRDAESSRRGRPAASSDCATRLRRHSPTRRYPPTTHPPPRRAHTARTADAAGAGRRRLTPV